MDLNAHTQQSEGVMADTPSGHRIRQWCGEGAGSGSEGNAGMAGPLERWCGDMYGGHTSDGDNGGEKGAPGDGGVGGDRGASVSTRVVSSRATYCMVVTLLTSH